MTGKIKVILKNRLVFSILANHKIGCYREV